MFGSTNIGEVFHKSNIVYLYYTQCFDFFINNRVADLKEIDSSANITDEFQTIRTKVFDLLGFDKSSNEWLALTALSNMRNTIHNNGIHLARNEKLKEIQIVYHDKLIWFKHENPHMNATYQIFNFILIDLIRLARQINDHAQITNIKSIEDKIEIKI